MIDRQQTELTGTPVRVSVVKVDGDKPYIPISKQQLAELETLLADRGIPYSVEHPAGHLVNEDDTDTMAVAVVKLEEEVAGKVQAILDSHPASEADKEFLKQGEPLLPTVSFDLSGGQNKLTITKRLGNGGQYKTFKDVRKAAIADVDGSLKPYKVPAPLLDTKYHALVGLKKHLEACTEADCRILQDLTKPGGGTYPPPDHQ